MQLNYKKKFIILKNKYSSIEKYKAKGHMKLEIKGVHINIHINIENGQEDTAYSLSLISDEIVELGKIFTDRYGKSKTELKLNREDFIQGELEEGAVIIHQNKDILLGEYIGKDDGKIEEFIRAEEAIVEEVEEIQETEEIIEPAEIEEKYLEVEDFQEEEYHPEELAQEEFYQEPEELPREEFYQEPEEFPQEDFHPEEYVDLEYEYNLKKKEQMTDYILSILRYFPYDEPFQQEIYDHNWWRIEYDGEVEDGFLPYFDYIRETNATASMIKYGHYLFGLYNESEEVKYYIYGIPGEFSLDEHPNGGVTGFKTWFKGRKEVGYWLLYIDPMTGEAVETMNPMKPS